MNDQEIKQQEDLAKRQAELENLPPITMEEYEKIVHKWLLLKDPHILRVLVYHYIANHLPGDPVWLMVLGASGSGKSEMLSMLYDLPDSYALSTLTPQTLVSGFNAKSDPSLIHQLSDKIVIFKDFTTIMSMQKDAQKEIMSQLREIFDGRFTKSFGNGKNVDWRGKVGMLSAATEQFDLFAQNNASMGERFIQYRFISADRKETARVAINNTMNITEMRTELSNAMYQVIKGIDYSKIPEIEIPNEVKERLINLADFACLARSAVIRDFGMKKEVVFVPSPEMPTRLTQQLVRFLQAAMLVRQGEWVEEDMAAVYKIALDSIPKKDRFVMQQLASKNSQTTAEIATRIGYPTSTAHSTLEDLSMKGLCERRKGEDSAEGGNADRWTLKSDYGSILREYDKIKTQEEIDKEAQEIAALIGGEPVDGIQF